MDDYILEILRMQEMPEQGQALSLRLDDPETLAIPSEQPERRAEKRTEEPVAFGEGGTTAEKSEEKVQRNVTHDRETVWRLLRQMEPVQPVSGTGTGIDEAQSGPKMERVLMASGQTPVRAEQKEVSPEALSMFFQRDARRYP